MGSLFLDELNYLREGGAQFARANPKIASHLGQGGEDPDVERLLEGFAYLSSQIQGKLFDESEEFNHSLISLLWPDFFCPFPSTTLMQLSPKMEHLQEKRIVSAGTTILSRHIEGIACPFRTTTDCAIYPLEMISSKWDQRTGGGASLRLDFSCPSHLALSAINLDNLRLTFCGEAQMAQMLYLWFGRYLKRARITVDGENYRLTPHKQLTPIGFSTQESILPYRPNVFDGNRLLREFFVFADKFYGYDLSGLRPYFAQSQASNFMLEIEFDRPLPSRLLFKPDSIRLYCVPAVNLFTHDGEPLLIAHEKTAYRVRPQGQDHHFIDIFSIDSVSAHPTARSRRKNRATRRFVAFESFLHEATPDLADENAMREQLYYYIRRRQAPNLLRFDHDISFIEKDGRQGRQVSVPDEEAISIEMSCFHRNLCHELAVGDICYPQTQEGDFATYQNIVRPTASLYPPLDGTLDWRLLINLALNYRSILDCDALKAILTIYDHAPLQPDSSSRPSRRRDYGVLALQTSAVDRLYRGFYLRGLKSTLTLKESAFQTEGEMYLFATILAQFFHLYASVNSFHELEVHGEDYGERYQWPAKIN